MHSFNDLQQLDREQAADYLLTTVNTALLTLKHPQLHIETYCRQNRRYRKANVLLFSDAQQRNHWYLIQIYNLADGYICNDDVVNPLNAGEITELEKKIPNNELGFNLNSPNTHISGFLFSQVRPYHYMYDQLVTYFQLSEKQCINQFSFTDKHCFYRQLPNGHALKQSDENDCYLFPCTRGGIYDDKYAEEMHSFIRTNSSLIPSKSDLTIWLGITAQKRSWLEQVEGQCNLVRELNKHYPSITVIIDGWTSLADGIPDSPKDISRDMAVFDALSTRLKKMKNIEIINLIGKDYKEKISYARSIDCFIANSGTGGMVPMMFTQKSGVLHSNGKLHTFERSYTQRVQNVPHEKIHAQDLSLDSGVYSIDWKVIYNLLADVLGLDQRLKENRVIKNKHYLNLKKFIFKKSIQIGVVMKKIKSKTS